MTLRPRRRIGAVLVGLLLLAWGGPGSAFDLETVAKLAQDLSERPYQAPASAELPQELLDLGASRYRDIRFKRDRAVWGGQRNLPFELELVHPGRNYRRPVRIHLLTADGIAPLPFRADYFDYGPRNERLSPQAYGDIGFAGFRVLHADPEGVKSELLNFLGASYFRGRTQTSRIGVAARGLAVDTGLLSGEEFPHFREFWIAWPRSADRHLRIYALLDSPRVAGAYRFVLRPGAATEVEVTARLHLRETVTKFGVAPLTSMFFFGENQRPLTEDYRPEVHKSDGLLVHTGNDEWVWRPLVNPRRLIVTSFSTRNPKGFGLMQRDRDFASYQDLDHRYERRPSLWVEPQGAWGSGRVELVQIPTPDEFNDNIVAYWVPETLPPVGSGMDFRYRLAWQHQDLTNPPSGWVVQSRRGRGWGQQDDDSLRFVVEFDGPRLRDLPDDAKLLGAIWLNDNGALMEREVRRNRVDGTWRLNFRFRRLDAEQPVEIRAFLKNDQEVLTETWSYLLAPG